MNIISPSELATKSVGIEPRGEKSNKPGACVFCGKHYQIGDLVEPLNLPITFFYHIALANPDGDQVCGYCPHVMNRKWMQTWAHSVITEDSLYKFASNNDIAYWLQNPPDKPFIMMRGDQQIQHLVWRTPVNYNREIYQVRVGEKLLTIRLAYLLKLKEAVFRLSDFQMEVDALKAKSTKSIKSFINPFICVSRDLDNPIGGQIKYKLLEAAKENEQVRADIHLVNQATEGEIWAMSIIPYATTIDAPRKQKIN